MPPPVFRFAPSPNGYLHLGHAYSALLNFDGARESGGRLLLRIEDIDTARCRPEFETAIYQDLGWLGIGWETSVRRQSEHLSEYRAAVAAAIAHLAEIRNIGADDRHAISRGQVGHAAGAGRGRIRHHHEGRGAEHFRNVMLFHIALKFNIWMAAILMPP